MSEVLDFIWSKLNEEVQTRRGETAKLNAIEKAGEAFSFPISTLADAPLAADGMSTYACRFISDGRKGGEGAGLGTGLPCYYNPVTDQWLTFHDNTAVTT